jgi:hypothetical protein
MFGFPFSRTEKSRSCIFLVFQGGLLSFRISTIGPVRSGWAIFFPVRDAFPDNRISNACSSPLYARRTRSTGTFNLAASCHGRDLQAFRFLTQDGCVTSPPMVQSCIRRKHTRRKMSIDTVIKKCRMDAAFMWYFLRLRVRGPEGRISIHLLHPFVYATNSYKRTHAATNERRAHNPEVAGSNPAPAKKASPATGFFHARAFRELFA